MQIENTHFTNNKKQKISARIHYPEKNNGKGVIFCHGLFSSKDGYKINRLAESITSTGHSLLTFDFSFSGESEGNISDISITQEAADLKCASDFLSSIGIKQYHLIGSSMGGTISLLHAGKESNSKNILSIITIATPVDLKKLFKLNIGSSIEKLSPEGYTSIDNIKLNNNFFIEAFKIDMVSHINKINVPALIFHGAGDKVVSVTNADIIENKLQSKIIKKKIIQHGDHNLTDNESMEILRNEIVNWLNKD